MLFIPYRQPKKGIPKYSVVRIIWKYRTNQKQKMVDTIWLSLFITNYKTCNVSRAPLALGSAYVSFPSRSNLWFCKRKTKTLIRLREVAFWIIFIPKALKKCLLLFRLALKINLYHSLGLFSRQQIMFFLFFPENRIWHFMQIVSSRDNLHETSNPVFGEKIRKIFQNVVCWNVTVKRVEIGIRTARPRSQYNVTVRNVMWCV